MKQYFLVWMLLPAALFAQMSPKDFETIRRRWAYFHTGEAPGMASIPLPPKMLSTYNSTAKEYVESALSAANKKSLWDDLSEWATNPAHITASFRRLARIAVAYKTPGTDFYKKADILSFIIKAYTRLNKEFYTAKGFSYGNWWDWQIGIPIENARIAVLLHEEIPADLKSSAMRSINRHLPMVDPASRYHTGANLSDVCIAKILQALSTENESLLQDTVQKLSTVFKIALYGDGVYEDGSLIQHGNLAYTGAYGAIMLMRLATVFYLLGSSPYALPQNIFGTWPEKVIDPILYQGMVFDNVRGRSISRDFDTAENLGMLLINSLALYSIEAEPQFKNSTRSIVRSWMGGLSDFYINTAGSPLAYAALKDIAKLPIPPFQEKAWTFNRMERDVSRMKGYTFTITRTSERIGKYEAINNENLMPWYQGDGIFHLYLDRSQYAEGYWASVDPYRLPGLIRAVRPMKPLSGINPGSRASVNKWSAGVNLESSSSAGMELGNDDDDLQGYKSWFMFPGEIVFMAGGLKSRKPIEAVLSQYRLKKDKSNTILAGGKPLGGEFSGSLKTIYIEGNAAGTSMGYWFFEPAQVNGALTPRTGYWTNINKSKNSSSSVSAEPVNDSYALFTLNFPKPKNEEFAYILLPNISVKELDAYKSKITCLPVEGKVHALYHESLGIGSANFFGKGKAGIFSSSSPLALMWKEKDGKLLLRYTDPVFSGAQLSLKIRGEWEPLEKNSVKSSVSEGETTLELVFSEGGGTIYETRLKKINPNK